MVEKERCTGCGACAAVCREGAIGMEPDREGFLYPVIDKPRSTGSGACDAVSPIDREETEGGEAPACWGARAREDAVRLGSSSGGIFPLLAGEVLAEGGAVYGAALLPGGRVAHIRAETPKELDRITKTKYVQSDIAGALEEIPRLLREGRRVLFCGTPCQAAAVRALAGEHPRLLLADLVCYGVPSPGIWRDYVGWLEKRAGGTLRSFSFRDKRGGDHGRTVAYRTGDRETALPLSRDLYCRSYFSRVNLRPACYRCRYCTTRRGSDLTLGDFWGIEAVRPDFDDGMGCSVVLCHTPAGRALWERARGAARSFPCAPAEAANPSQPRLRKPTQRPARRGLLMGLYRRLPFGVWIRLFTR